MTGLSRETEEVLRRARLTEAMPESRRRRIKVAVVARLAAAGGVALKAGEAAGAGFWASAIGTGVKGVASLVVVASLGAGGYVVARTHRPAIVATPVGATVLRESAPHRVAPEKSVAPIEPAVRPTSHDAPHAASRMASRGPVSAPPRARSAVTVAPVEERAPAVGPSPLERSTLAEEMPLLRAADRALRAGNADAALAWLEQHAARFPDGVLAPERAGERLIALCQLGKADRAAAARFLASHDGSPLAARVKQSCGLAGR